MLIYRYTRPTQRLNHIFKLHILHGPYREVLWSNLWLLVCTGWSIFMFPTVLLPYALSDGCAGQDLHDEPLKNVFIRNTMLSEHYTVGDSGRLICLLRFLQGCRVFASPQRHPNCGVFGIIVTQCMGVSRQRYNNVSPLGLDEWAKGLIRAQLAQHVSLQPGTSCSMSMLGNFLMIVSVRLKWLISVLDLPRCSYLIFLLRLKKVSMNEGTDLRRNRSLSSTFGRRRAKREQASKDIPQYSRQDSAWKKISNTIADVCVAALSSSL